MGDGGGEEEEEEEDSRILQLQAPTLARWDHGCWEETRQGATREDREEEE